MKKLEPAHHGVAATARERKLVRLWIETGAPYPGTYAALGTGMIGSYTENQLDRQDLAWPAVKTMAAAIERRCGSCHTPNQLPLPLSASDDQKLPPWQGLEARDLRRRVSRHLLYNLSRPEKSMLLLAPLARAAGGYGICPGTLGDTADPDYRAILAGIAESARKLEEIKRFDMPGFRPRVDWVREMKRFGILPRTQNPADPVDYYAAEREYWKSLWYKPLER